jgi:tRNA G37 N-methylase Trm5
MCATRAGLTLDQLRTARLKDVKDRVVVDLYAGKWLARGQVWLTCVGIGYWVFPYLCAGATCVYACEINPYSCVPSPPFDHLYDLSSG